MGAPPDDDSLFLEYKTAWHAREALLAQRGPESSATMSLATDPLAAAIEEATADLEAARYRWHYGSSAPRVRAPAAALPDSAVPEQVAERWALILHNEPNYRGELTASTVISGIYATEADAVKARDCHPEWRRAAVERLDPRRS